MTNQDAIKILKPLFEQCKGKNGCLGYIEHFFTKNEEEAIDLAIKALESNDVLDKIRAEIEALMPPLGNWMYEEGHIEEQTACEVIADVLHIIDKYKVES